MPPLCRRALSLSILLHVAHYPFAPLAPGWNTQLRAGHRQLERHLSQNGYDGREKERNKDRGRLGETDGDKEEEDETETAYYYHFYCIMHVDIYINISLWPLQLTLPPPIRHPIYHSSTDHAHHGQKEISMHFNTGLCIF